MDCEFPNCTEKETRPIIKVGDYELVYCVKHSELVASLYSTWVQQLIDFFDKPKMLESHGLLRNTTPKFKEYMFDCIIDLNKTYTKRKKKFKFLDTDEVEGICAINGCQNTKVRYCFSLGKLDFYYCFKHWDKDGEQIFSTLNSTVKGSQNLVGLEMWEKINSIKKTISNMTEFNEDSKIFIQNIKRYIDEEEELYEKNKDNPENIRGEIRWRKYK